MEKSDIFETRAQKQQAAKILKNKGWSCVAIASYVGASVKTVECWFYRRKANARKASQQRYLARKSWDSKPSTQKLPPANLENISRAKIEQDKRDLAARMAPASTEIRDKTAQICGDPLYHRSALNSGLSGKYRRKTRPIVPIKQEMRDDGFPIGARNKYAWLS